jgi:hypothetical protein
MVVQFNLLQDLLGNKQLVHPRVTGSNKKDKHNMMTTLVIVAYGAVAGLFRICYEDYSKTVRHYDAPNK